MPFYEYQCKSCEHQLEVLQKVSDPPLRKCPHCGKQQLQRLISAPVFRLKGSGWYETDFKSDKESKRNLVEKESKDAGDKENVKPAEAKAGDKTDVPAKPESKTESKPAEKPAPKETKSTSAAKSSRAKPAAKPKKKAARR